MGVQLSIITVNYNNVEGLRNTIDSVVQNKLQCNVFEYIVIDGGSSDGSLEAIREKKQFIDYWISEKDEGIYNAMNKGVRCSNGKYCLFLNSGDVLFRNNVIKRILPLLESEDDYISGREIMNRNGHPYVFHIPPRTVCPHFFRKNSLRHQATFIKRTTLIDIPYDEKYKLVSDWKHSSEVLAVGHGSYKRINIIVDVCEREGATFQNREKGKVEREEVFTSLFPTIPYQLNKFEKFCKQMGHYKEMINARLIWLYDK